MSTTVSYEEAGRVLSAALARATETASPSCVAVLDSGRNLVAFARQDGAIGVGGGSPDQDADIAAAGAGSLSAVPE